MSAEPTAPAIRPRVTIDLEYFNDLLKKVNATAEEHEKPLKDAKEIIVSILNSRGNLKEALEDITRKGIKLVIKSFDSNNRIQGVDDVIIENYKPEEK